MDLPARVAGPSQCAADELSHHRRPGLWVARDVQQGIEGNLPARVARRRGDEGVDEQLVTGLANGTVLVCELWSAGLLADRWLVHRDFVDEFRHMQNRDEIRIVTEQRRARAG